MRRQSPAPQPTFFSKDVFLANALGSSSQTSVRSAVLAYTVTLNIVDQFYLVLMDKIQNLLAIARLANVRACRDVTGCLSPFQ
jgi:hypothetical protein